MRGLILTAIAVLCACSSDSVDLDSDGFPAGTDCNDLESGIYPGASEIAYDGIDQDCSGTDLTDVDGDGDGAIQAGGDDCDDTNPGRNPGQPEIPYNGVDDDCSFETRDDDRDGDGFSRAAGDCNDDDPTRYPGADEVPYDGSDQDCSGRDLQDVDRDGFMAVAVGGPDCDDTRPDLKPGGVELCGDNIDQDCSGADLSCSVVDGDRDGFTPESGDCNDAVATVNPGRAEVAYNGVDEDCNADTRDDDLDRDGFARVGGGDCNDEIASVFPGADEVPYDGIDQDCSGSDLQDVDRDGFAGTAAGGEDCDDLRPDVKPSGVDACGDLVDQDCTGADLECSDVDGDGDGASPRQGDCNDGDVAIGPAVEEIPYSGIDEDCDATTVDDDLDHDGFAKVGGGDCDDGAAEVFPGADEVPYDGIDQDCSGSDLIDVDSDGYDATVAGGKDCDDRRADIHPRAIDLCSDGIDQDCQGGDASVCLFDGVKQNVRIDKLGWVECYAGAYNANFVSLENRILADCDKDHLLLACREKGGSTLRVAASGHRDDVLFDTGVNAGEVHTSGGVNWYHNSSWSWGFAPAGQSVNKNDCDLNSLASNDRLCWRTVAGNLDGGYRCGDQIKLDTSDEWERVVYHRD